MGVVQHGSLCPLQPIHSSHSLWCDNIVSVPSPEEGYGCAINGHCLLGTSTIFSSYIYSISIATWRQIAECMCVYIVHEKRLGMYYVYWDIGLYCRVSSVCIMYTGT